jgi:CheY-like chemotaxis protein
MNLKVLVAEPSYDDWISISRGVRRRLPDASILRVEDGEQALRLTADPQMPQLVLLAARLPVVSGERVLDQLRRDPRTRSIPILVAWKDGYNAKVEKIEAFRGDEWLFTIFCTVALEEQVADAVRRLYDPSEPKRPRMRSESALRII